MEIINFTVQQFLNFFIIFVRIAGIFIVAPFFGSRNIPGIAKVGFSLWLSLVLFPLIKKIEVPTQVIPFFGVVLQQLLLGLIIGYTALLIFIAVQLAGHILDIQVGYSIINIVDPQTGMQVSLIGQFYYLMAILIFLLINGHHLFIQALVKSFDLIPLSGIRFSPGLLGYIDRFTADIFIIGVKIAIPTMAVLLLAEVSMGFVARTVPQINIFLVGFPLRIGLGLLFIAISFPFFTYVCKNLIEELYKNILIILRTMSV